MPESAGTSLVRCGNFDVDVRTGELWKDGARVTLQSQPLNVLAALLERPGELVSRDELRQRLWPGDTHVDFEHGLNAAVKRLRDVLGDSAELPTYIETIPRRGYRLIAPLSMANGKPVTAPPVESLVAAVGVGVDRRRRRRLLSAIVVMVGVLPAAFAILHWLESPPPIVAKYTQLTADGENKDGMLVTDGLRVYFVQHVNDEPRVAQVSVAGGETIPVPVPFGKPGLDDIAHDGSMLFVGNYEGAGPFPYWIVPLPGGSPRPLGELRANDVHPSPDGQQIVYTSNSDIFIAKADATGARKLASFPGKGTGTAAWDHDGSRVRFSVNDWSIPESSIWEARPDGSGLRPLLPGWRAPATQCCGRWTPDGAYFIFESTLQGVTSLWAIREKGGFWRKASGTPVQLTTGALHFRSPAPSRDGRTIFAIGDQVRGEILRRDSRSGEWVPLSSGLSIKSMSELAYSRDGQWVAYTTYPEMTLWRSRVDDTERRQLTFSPLEVRAPRWSPDGKKLVINARPPGQPWKLSIIGAEGGSPEPLLAGPESQSFPAWSPDGRQIAFSGSPLLEPEGTGPSALHILDLATKRVTRIPGSEGLFGASWSPNGRWLAALKLDFSKLMLLDVASGRWEELATGVLHYANWSADSEHLYYERWGDDVGAMRIRLSDRREEKIGSLKKFRRTLGPERCWSGLTPNNELLVLRDIGTQEIYALDLKKP